MFLQWRCRQLFGSLARPASSSTHSLFFLQNFSLFLVLRFCWSLLPSHFFAGEPGGVVILYFQFRIKVLELITVEMDFIICYDYFWHSKMAYYVLSNELQHACSCNILCGSAFTHIVK